MRTVHKTLLTLVSALFFLAVFSAPLVANEQAQEAQLIPFKGYDLDGKPVDVQKSIGNKAVMLIFWASWCPSCKTEVPKINQLAGKFRARGMEFVAVNVGYNDSVERAQAFARKTGMTYPAIFDGSGKITERYQLQGVPTIIIADKKGKILFRNFATPDISEANFSLLTAD